MGGEEKRQVMQRQSLTTSHHQIAHAIYEIHIFWKSSPNVLLLSMALHGMEHFPYIVQNIPLTSLGPLSQLSPPPSSFTLLAFSPWQGVKWEREKALTLCKPCAATDKTLVCQQHLFGQKFKIQHHRCILHHVKLQNFIIVQTLQ